MTARRFPPSWSPRVWWSQKGLVGVQTRWKSLRLTLERLSPLAWLPILCVSSLSLLVGYCNYQLQRQNQPPNLEFSNGVVGEKERFIRLYWNNVGKSNAWRARAKLFNFVDGKRSDSSFAEADIVGAGAKVMAGYGGQAEYHLTTEIPPRFLVCFSYSDASNNGFEKAVFLSLAKRENGPAIVDETPAPGAAICR